MSRNSPTPDEILENENIQRMANNSPLLRWLLNRLKNFNDRAKGVKK